jgi:uncharacterized membrane protein YphA (DoxX/SURF4 family)
MTLTPWEWGHAALGAVASVIFLVQTFGSMDDDSGADGGFDDDGGGLSEYLSVRNFVAFFIGYGWVTFVALVSGFDPRLASLCGAASGALFVMASLFIVRSFMKLHEDGSVKLEELVGAGAFVYIAIGGDASSQGKVMVDTKHGRLELPARTKDPSKLSAGQWVSIVGTDSGILWVSEEKPSE